MKKVKKLCIFVALILCALTLVSCAEEKSVKNVTVKFQVPSTENEGNATVLLEYTFEEIKGENGAAPTVLRAAEMALSENDKKYEIAEDGHYIFEAFGYKNDNTNFWEATVNDRKLNTTDDKTELCDNDVVVYTYTVFDRNNHPAGE